MTARLKGDSLFFKASRNYKSRIATACFGIADPVSMAYAATTVEG
jgi:hypothetical protein